MVVQIVLIQMVKLFGGLDNTDNYKENTYIAQTMENMMRQESFVAKLKQFTDQSWWNKPGQATKGV